MRVFISYAWEDDEYRALVKSLAVRLREDGIDARLDVWHLEGLTIPEFMSREVRHADKIIVVCSPQYRRKVHAMEDGERMTGVGWESLLLTSSIWSNVSNRKMITPVLLRGSWRDASPDVLTGLPYFDLSNMANFEPNYRNLLRSLTGLSEPAPPLGRLPEIPRKPVRPLRGLESGAPTENQLNSNPRARTTEEISRFLARVLRHDPDAARVTLDSKGWADVSTLLKGLEAAGYPLMLDGLEILVVTSKSKRDTPRFTLSPDRHWIRANWGHTIPIDNRESSR